MNGGSRRLALYVIGLVALSASVDALLHSYAGLFGWAAHHRLGGWQALSWPAEIDVFLVVGELALYVAYLDGWPVRQRLWPWVTAVTGLVISVAGNVGHVQALPGVPVTLADRLTAATSPVAAFAGLMVGLQVLKMGRHLDDVEGRGAELGSLPTTRGGVLVHMGNEALLAEAAEIFAAARASGRSVSQRSLATQLRSRGYRFSNDALRGLVAEVSPGSDEQAA